MSEQLLGNEIFERLKNIKDKEQQAALGVASKIRRGELVSDGELLDALYAFMVRLDLANPMLPICHETLKRFMVYGGVTETPRGIQRGWLVGCSNPDCIGGKLAVGCSVGAPLITVDCPDCVRSSIPREGK
jgi:hypothetical protein